jgi:hypothetical protein
MKTRELIVILTVAAITFGGLGLMRSQTADAVAKVVTTAEPGQPTLDIDGALVVLNPAAKLEAAGKCPAVKMTVSNPTDAPVTIDIKATVMVTPPMSFASRRGPISTPKWEQSCPSIALAPGEQREVTVQPDLQLAAGESYSFVISAPSGNEVQPTVAVRNGSIVVPGYQDAMLKALEEAKQKQAETAKQAPAAR